MNEDDSYQHDVLMLHLLPIQNDKHCISFALIISSQFRLYLLYTAQYHKSQFFPKGFYTLYNNTNPVS